MQSKKLATSSGLRPHTSRPAYPVAPTSGRGRGATVEVPGLTSFLLPVDDKRQSDQRPPLPKMEGRRGESQPRPTPLKSRPHCLRYTNKKHLTRKLTKKTWKKQMAQQKKLQHANT